SVRPVRRVAGSLGQRSSSVMTEIKTSYMASTSAVIVPFLVYVFSYLVWINYTSRGQYFDGILGRQLLPLPTKTQHTSPPILRTIYAPLIWIDGRFGRLFIIG